MHNFRIANTELSFRFQGLAAAPVLLRRLPTDRGTSCSEIAGSGDIEWT